MSKFLDSTLQHMSVCTSQYDATCRALADDLLKTRGALREVLKFGEHDGPCTNEGEESDGPCQLHLEASERRDLAAHELLKGTDG